MNLASITWDADPILLSLGPLQIRWYGALFATGFVCAYIILRKIYQRENQPADEIDSLLMWMVGGTILGARLGEVLFYEPAYYFKNPLEIPLIWQGGLASHGAAIGVYVALYLFWRRKKRRPYLWYMDRICVGAALIAALIRVGNFFNSEIIGTPTDLPWGVRFLNLRTRIGTTPEDLLPRHPAQLYEAISYFCIFFFILWLYRRLHSADLSEENADRNAGIIHGAFLIAVFFSRFLIEFSKVRQAAFTVGFPLSMGQMLSIPLIITGAVLVYTRLKQQPSMHQDTRAPNQEP